ncbi:MAG: translation initiation factor IF-2 [Deltaproteobacteria bacterium]|nr:translation initiation factor IF-2 [Deltaproteobacteria bacterium]
MAKVRIYELARELNMDSKALVQRLQTGGMKIKNYMSVLDGEAVVKAKDIVSGTVSEVVEEKRIKPTVIRRRKKTIKVESDKPAVGVDTEAEQVEVELEKPKLPEEKKLETVKPTSQKVEKEKKSEETPVVKEKEQPTEEIKEKLRDKGKGLKVPAEDKVKAKAKKKKKRIADQPAKIIKMPEKVPLKEVIIKQKDKIKKSIPAKQLSKDLEVLPREGEKEKPYRKKGGKRRDETRRDTTKGLFIRTRKIEVFERADLYDGRIVRRKEKRTAKKSREARKKFKQTAITVPRAIKRRIKVPENVTVVELAKAMGVKAVELIRKLMNLGVKSNLNQSIDFETASVVADDLGFELELDRFEMESILGDVKDKPEDLKPRPPVVTIMGHVDHGKTSLLDYIRKSNIIAGESGGITQHIGAYYVEKEEGDIIFLDTPGHEAFTAMRARGAKITDIIVLVVAAEDGVMPQTKEAINHARAANIPIVVAINKIDKAEADPEKVKRELADLELVPEEWGGDTISGNISAKTGQGVDELLELVLLQADMLELNANPDRPARGTIIEARLDKSKGPVATVLIKDGTLRQGHYFVCGESYGRVRAMLNSRGKRMDSASPSVPVEIYGISGVPMAGDKFIVVPDEKRAKQVIEHRQAQMKSKDKVGRGIVSLEDLFEKIKEGDVKELNIILKTDVQGSLEALSDSLIKLSTEEVKLKVIHSSTGAITETDIMLASASGAIVIGFNVRANLRVTGVAEKEKIDIRYYDVIYNAIKDVRLAMVGLLEPVYKENIIGRVGIKEIFHVPKVGTVAGCYVTDGYIERNANIRLLRDSVVIFDGKMASLRRFKEDVKEVQSGFECGIGLENFQDIKPGDVFEVYQMEEIEAEL